MLASTNYDNYRYCASAGTFSPQKHGERGGGHTVCVVGCTVPCYSTVTVNLNLPVQFTAQKRSLFIFRTRGGLDTLIQKSVLCADAGTFSPYEHGEVYVLDDGGEVDLDLGNYERFLDVSLTRDNNITTGTELLSKDFSFTLRSSLL
jgi:hypothetical protein